MWVTWYLTISKTPASSACLQLWFHCFTHFLSTPPTIPTSTLLKSDIWISCKVDWLMERGGFQTCSEQPDAAFTNVINALESWPALVQTDRQHYHLHSQTHQAVSGVVNVAKITNNVISQTARRRRRVLLCWGAGLQPFTLHSVQTAAGYMMYLHFSLCFRTFLSCNVNLESETRLNFKRPTLQRLTVLRQIHPRLCGDTQHSGAGRRSGIRNVRGWKKKWHC